MINSLVRPNIRNLKPYSSARSLYQTGVFYDANENALGSVVEVSCYPELNRYPDPYSRDLRKALSEYASVDEKNIFAGNGADEAIDLLIRIFVNPDEEILIFEPTYGMYRVAADTAGVEVRTCPLDKNFQIDTELVLRRVTSKTKIIFCCSPNNPTGNLMRAEDIRAICKKFKGIVVVDEAYIEFTSSPSFASEVSRFENLVVLRTFSKAWGLAGLRVGYAIANSKIIEYIDKVKAPYNLNRVASKFALEALQKQEKMLRMRDKILKERTRFAAKLEEMGVQVFPSDANFLLVKFQNASQIAQKLANDDLIVRDFEKNERLNDCVRISIATPKQNDLLLRSLSKIL